MVKQKEKTSDFRYSTGESKVPWAAIGENINAEDVIEVLKFLIPAGEDEQGYKEELLKIKELIKKLCEKGHYATKLTFGRKMLNI